MYKTRSAFFVKHRWVWHTWTHSEGNKHAAIVAKGLEIGAAGWDFGNADHGEASRVNF